MWHSDGQQPLDGTKNHNMLQYVHLAQILMPDGLFTSVILLKCLNLAFIFISDTYFIRTVKWLMNEKLWPTSANNIWCKCEMLFRIMFWLFACSCFSCLLLCRQKNRYIGKEKMKLERSKNHPHFGHNDKYNTPTPLYTTKLKSDTEQTSERFTNTYRCSHMWEMRE